MNLLRCSASSASKTIFSMQWLGNLLQRPAQFVATRGHRSLTNGPTRAVLQLERVGASKRASSPTGIQSSTLPAPNQALQLLSAAHSCRHRFFTSESSHLSAEKMPRSDNAREAQELISCLYKDGQAPKVALCATGGAAQAAAWFLATPGASASILDIQYPYHRDALVDYVQGDIDESESFASKEMARRLARHAKRRALTILANAEGQNAAAASKIVGVGYSGALATSRERKGEDKCFVVLAASDGQEILHSVKFPKGKASRLEQDELASLAVVRALTNWTQGKVQTIGFNTDDVLEDSVQELKPAGSAESVKDNLNNLLEDSNVSAAWFWPIANGKQRAVDLYTNSTLERTVRHLIVSGSFNPLHKGHETMAIAARGLKQRLQPNNGKQSIGIAFELSIKNADKGEIDLDIVRSRVEQFAQSHTAMYGPWPVVVTQASIFVDKAAIFPASTFVIGYDTAVRIVDPKYYDNSRGKMNEALLAIAKLGCDFVVVGRVGPNNTFLTLEDMKDDIPEGFRGLFLGLSEADFRLDISSTEIRAQRSRQ